MSNLPIPKTDIASLIFAAYEKAAEKEAPRTYLGMSQIGDPCERKLWYYFRHVKRISFPGRTLCLFERGQNEESPITKKLRSIGITVIDRDEATGEQFGFIGYKGHAKGHMDAVLHGVPAAPKTYHVGEYKTHGDKSFQDLIKNGVAKSKPVHEAQMQEYMGHSGMDRALYVAVNKNDDDIYAERLHFDKARFDELEAKTARIIDASEPPQRMKEDSTWFECRWCDYREICHSDKIPLANCRTCARSTPIDGGKWSCEKHGEATGLCDDHIYIPALLGRAVDGADHFVEYEGFRNVSADSLADGFSSKQLEEIGHVSLVPVAKVFAE